MTLSSWHLAYFSFIFYTRLTLKHLFKTSFDPLCHRIVWPRQCTLYSAQCCCFMRFRELVTWWVYTSYFHHQLPVKHLHVHILCDKKGEIRLRFLLQQLAKKTCLKRRRREVRRDARTWGFPSPLSLSYFSIPSPLVSTRSSAPTWSWRRFARFEMSRQKSKPWCSS